eukprot:c55829_g1_i1 orf=101-250(-)
MTFRSDITQLYHLMPRIGTLACTEKLKSHLPHNQYAKNQLVTTEKMSTV